MTFCRSIYVKKVMKLLAFIFEQPSYMVDAQREIDQFIATIRKLGLSSRIKPQMYVRPSTMYKKAPFY